MNRKALIAGTNVPDAPLELTVTQPTLGKRLLKSFGILLAMLIATAVTALIPIVHFITVPLMLILTFIIVASSLRKSEIIEAGIGTCPNCKAPFRVFKRRFKLPFNDVCEACHRQVTIKSGGPQ